MEELSADQLFDIFIDTLGYLDEKYLSSDSDLEYFIMEELDSDAHTFFHSNTVNKLINAKLISASIGSDVNELRELIIGPLQNKMKLESIRDDSQWQEARYLAKCILKDIKKCDN